jgi:hypothetical protein
VDLRFQYSESRAPSWYRDTPPPSLFIDQMLTWHSLNALRLVLLIFAWVLLLTDSQVHVMGASAAGLSTQNLAELLLQDEIALGEDAGGVHLTPQPRTPVEPEQRPERASRRGSLRSSASTRSGRSSQATRRSTTPAA